MKLGTKFWGSGLAVFAVVVALIGVTVVSAANSKPDGQTVGELNNAWWQWALSIPTPTNPLLDTTGAKCHVKQSGPVFFLAGTLGSGSATRSCTIPAGKTLFFPTINFFQNNVGVTGNTNCPPTNFSLQDMWGILDNQVATVTTHEATVDGVPQQDFRAGPNNPPSSVMVSGNNLFTYLCGKPAIPAGTYYPNVTDGFYVKLAPLSAGWHTIHFSATTSQGTQQDITYHLTVQ